MTTELAQLRGQDASAAQIHLAFLRELLAQRKRALFGDSSEKRSRSDDGPRSTPAPPPGRSRRGLEVAALFYSLIESAKLCGVEPKAYLLYATRAALKNPGTATLPLALLTA